MEKCFSCLSEKGPFVPYAWHAHDSPEGRQYCGPCFARAWPAEKPIAFSASAVLGKWKNERFAPTHCMMEPSGQRVFALASQLDAHHVGQMKDFFPKLKETILEQMARDYRVTGALALMSTREWFDQMAIWYACCNK